ncbi:zinc ribbon domain-containing protein [Ilumatobacter sp.]|uniref:zinc ribbon domain-containing protein n=1 Tax=Ilumatobacter sp. TaxID=1967498 RepID=UPI003B529145
MTDVDSASGPGTDPGGGSTADRLLRLQHLDTEADQLVNRRERLPERDALSEATDHLRRWEAERTAMRDRIDELEAGIERSESESGELGEQRGRLQAQLKTVIAPREAEALMHEIEVLDRRTDELDTAELEALEEQSAVDDRLTSHLAAEPGLREATSTADTALERASSEIDAELSTVVERRDRARTELSDQVLSRYDRLRSSAGVAVAELVGHRCAGCHLDLSAAEVDDVKDDAAAADGVADCPQCGRMLVV